MHPNQPYSAASLMSFQMSVLRLGVALEQAAPIGSPEMATGAMAEAERLRNLIESHERC
jgi:hypothetical protein